jgi:hypothetical protein
LSHKGEEVKAKYRKQLCAHYAREAIRRHESSPHGALFSPPFPPREKRLALPAKKEFGFSHCVTRLDPLSRAGLHSAPCVLHRKNFD